VDRDIHFELQPSVSEIPRLIHKYHEDPDKECLAAGARIRSGDFSKENLRIIYRWKMQSFSYLGSEKRYFDNNSDSDIRDTLRAVVDELEKSDVPRRPLRELQALKGVGLSVASAILTAIFPDRLTVIDVMALRALGIPNPPVLNECFYSQYLSFCRAEAMRLGINLRDFDRALWQWGHDNPPKNSN
jgi:hypothetical protein